MAALADSLLDSQEVELWCVQVDVDQDDFVTQGFGPGEEIDLRGMGEHGFEAEGGAAVEQVVAQDFGLGRGLVAGALWGAWRQGPGDAVRIDHGHALGLEKQVMEGALARAIGAAEQPELFCFISH